MQKLLFSPNNFSSFCVGVLLTSLLNYQFQEVKQDRNVGLPIYDYNTYKSNGLFLPNCNPDIVHVWEGKINGSSVYRTQIINREIAKFNDEHSKRITPGGHFSPSLQYNCSPLQNVALIIPYRDRSEDLHKFIPFIHNFLQRQRVKYTIYIIEQSQKKVWNKGKLFNVGFEEARKREKFDCFIFHDVDTLPIDDRNYYVCGLNPSHPITGLDYIGFKANIKNYAIKGGVLKFSPNSFMDVNGFSNKFWGWGGEDDEMWRRIMMSNLAIVRPFPKEIGFYMTTNGQSHGHPDLNKKNHKKVTNHAYREQNIRVLRNAHKTFRHDGLVSLQYNVMANTSEPYYTNIIVDI